MKKIYVHPWLLVWLFLLTSCTVSPQTEQNRLTARMITQQQELRQGSLLHDQAVQQLRKTDPQAYVLYEQARAAEAQGQAEVAIEIYHKAMQQAPENGLLLTSLGMAYLRNEDMIPARRYLLQAVNVDPDYYEARLGLGYIYLQNRQLLDAVNQLEVSLQLLPTLQGTFLLGEAEEAQGHLSRARQLYQTVVAVDKQSKLGIAAASRLRSLAE